MALEIIQLNSEPVDNPPAGFIYRWADDLTGLPRAKDENGVAYDFTGPQGDQGIQGIQGDPGPAGPAGPSFVVGYAENVTPLTNNTDENVSYLQSNIAIPSAGDYEIHFAWQ